MKGGDGLHGMRTPDGLRASLGQTEVLHLAGLDQFFDRPSHLFDRHVRINAMLVEQVDDIGLQAPERPFDRFLDVLRSAVEDLLLVVGAESETELGGDDDALSKRRQRLADNLLVQVRSIDFRCVEEAHAALYRRADQSDGL